MQKYWIKNELKNNVSQGGLLIKNLFEKLGLFIQNNRAVIIAAIFLLIMLSLQSTQYIEMASGTGAVQTSRSQMILLGVFLILIGLLFVYRDIAKALFPIIPMLVIIGWSGLVMSALDIAYNPHDCSYGCLILGIGSEYSILMMELAMVVTFVI